MAFVRELYMAKSFEELQKYTEIKEGKINGDKIVPLMVKLFLASEETFLSGDEEKAYVYYTRFFKFLQQIEEQPEFKEQRKIVIESIGGVDALENAKESVNVIKELIIQRYALIYKSVSNNLSSSNAESNHESSKQTVPFYNYTSMYKQLVDKVLLRSMEDQDESYFKEINEKNNHNEQLLHEIDQLEQEKKMLLEKLNNSPGTDETIDKEQETDGRQKPSKLLRKSLKSSSLLSQVVKSEKMVVQAVTGIEANARALHEECKRICSNMEHFVDQTCSIGKELENFFASLKNELKNNEIKVGSTKKRKLFRE